MQTGQLTANMKPDEVTERAQKAFEIALMAIDKEMSEMEAVESGHDQSGSTSVMTLLSSSHIVCGDSHMLELWSTCNIRVAASRNCETEDRVTATIIFPSIFSFPELFSER